MGVLLMVRGCTHAIDSLQVVVDVTRQYHQRLSQCMFHGGEKHMRIEPLRADALQRI